MTLAPVPELPKLRDGSLRIVSLFDQIRFDFDKLDGFEEFYWFAREYPRASRHHLDHAEHRLISIHRSYQSASTKAERMLATADANFIEGGFFDGNSRQAYWDFESYLSATGSALDILARLVGLAFEEQTPPSFNKLCNKLKLGGPVETLRRARDRWVSRMKDYRDCYTHYTPVDTILSFHVERCADGWELRGQLPVNPNVRDIFRFRYSRRVELLRYAITTYKQMSALDTAIAKEIRRLYKQRMFPKRSRNLFALGVRGRE
jgi:hypothetical protein